MTVHPLIAARTLGSISNWSLSNLSLNKILYFSHMVQLGRSNGTDPLVQGGFQAWNYGPVAPAVYHRAKVYGSKPVRDIFHAFPIIQDGVDREVIEEAYRFLSDKSPGQLVAITHWEHGAWAAHYQAGQRGIHIPDRDIYAEYQNRVR